MKLEMIKQLTKETLKVYLSKNYTLEEMIEMYLEQASRKEIEKLFLKAQE